MTLQERRQAEIERYHRPEYYGLMRGWRQVLLREWLTTHISHRAVGEKVNYLDVGCGMGESLDIAAELGLTARGCETLPEVCERENVDMIPGAHELPYFADAFALTSCNDVMEHILEDDVPQVLKEISRVTSGAVLLGISRHPGRFHITIKDENWWLAMIQEYMTGTAEVVFADRIPKIKQPYVWVSIT